MRHTSTKPSTKLMSRNQIQYRVYALETGKEVKAGGETKPLSSWKRRQYELQVKAWKARKGLPVYISMELESVVPNPELPLNTILVVKTDNGPAIRNRLRAIEPEADPYFTRKGYQEYLEAMVDAAEKQLEPFDPRTQKPREVSDQMAKAMGYARNMASSELAIARY